MKHYNIKTWHLDGELDPSDLEYLRACTMHFEVKGYDIIDYGVPNSHGVTKTVGKWQPTKAMTQSEEQESALLLKYSERLHLAGSIHVAEDSIYFEQKT